LRAAHHHRPLQRIGGYPARLLDRRQARLQGLLGLALGKRVQGGEDAQALAAQILFAIVARQLEMNELQESRIRRSAG